MLLGVTGLMRIFGNLSFSLGLAAGLDRGKLSTSTSGRRPRSAVVPAESWTQIRVLGRAGLTFAW